MQRIINQFCALNNLEMGMPYSSFLATMVLRKKKKYRFNFYNLLGVDF